MKPLTQLTKTIALFVTALLMVCFWLVPLGRAVVPPPDGGYPNFTTAEGTNALKHLTSGAGNTGVGWYSIFSATTASFNTGVGAGTLALNGGDENTATGVAALLLNTTGFQNTANGALALLNNDTGSDNTATGFQALSQNTTGANNTATGGNSLGSNSEGSGNTAVGTLALGFNSTGGGNTAVGVGALLHNTFLSDNTAVGALALANSIGMGNTAVGSEALTTNTIGDNNTAIGIAALHDSTGSGNIAIGPGAGQSITTGNNNINIGFAVSGGGSESNNIRIGSPNLMGQCFIASIRGVTTVNNDAVNVVIDGAGQLGTISSSRRFKKEIKPMDKASEGILALKPVTFHYKTDKMNRPEFGLIAEEVADVNPALVVRDKDGEIYTVRYDAINAMLLNEFLKEHATVQELKKEIAALKAGLQEVSHQLKVSRSVQLAENSQ